MIVADRVGLISVNDLSAMADVLIMDETCPSRLEVMDVKIAGFAVWCALSVVVLGASERYNASTPSDIELGQSKC